MIAFLSGTILNKDSEKDKVILLVNDIGYLISVSKQTLDNLSLDRKENLYIHTIISENDMCLYGFLDIYSKRLFELLLTVNGIGPKAAFSLISTLSNNELIYAICNNETKMLSKANGIGAKAAQKINLDLSSKLKKNIDYYTNNISSTFVSEIKDSEKEKEIIRDTKEGLKKLGFSVQEIDVAINKTETKNKNVEQLIIELLKKLAK